MRKNMFVVLFVIAALLPTVTAWAYVFDGVDVNVEYWAGTGTNEALCVVDFGANTYAFGYKWESGTPSGFDMIQAIDTAGALDIVTVVYSWGVMVNGISYDSDSHIGFGGGNDDWWQYWTSNDGSTWESSWVGASDRYLSNATWDGWGYGFATAPNVPIVPEPTSIMTLTSLIGLAASKRLLRRSGK